MPLKVKKLNKKRIERAQMKLSDSYFRRRKEMLENPHPLLSGFSVNVSEQDIDHVKDINKPLHRKNSRALNLAGSLALKKDIALPEFKPPKNPLTS